MEKQQANERIEMLESLREQLSSEWAGEEEADDIISRFLKADILDRVLLRMLIKRIDVYSRIGKKNGNQTQRVVVTYRFKDVVEIEDNDDSAENMISAVSNKAMYMYEDIIYFMESKYDEEGNDLIDTIRYILTSNMVDLSKYSKAMIKEKSGLPEMKFITEFCGVNIFGYDEYSESIYQYNNFLKSFFNISSFCDSKEDVIDI